MCRLPTLTVDFYPLFDDELEEGVPASPFNSSLADVSFDSDLEIFSEGASSFPVGPPSIKQEDGFAYLDQAVGGTLPGEPRPG